jgi:hypothetical protein
MRDQNAKNTLPLSWFLGPAACVLLAGCMAPDPGSDASSQATDKGTEPAPEAAVVKASPGPTPVDADWEAAGFARERGITLAEAKRRMGWQVHAPDLAERARADLGERFGGVWIDVADGDRIKVGVTRATSTARGSRSVGGGSGASSATIAAPTVAVQRSAAAVGLIEGVDAVEVLRPMAALERANTWLSAQIARVNDRAEVTLAAGLRTDLNAVELDVPDQGTLTAAQHDLVTTASVALGDTLVIGSYHGHVATHGCVYPNCDPPLRGGVLISSSDGVFCTGGFTAKSNVNAGLYQFTAGHCGEESLTGATWSARASDGSAVALGPMHHWEWDSGGDMAIVLIEDTSTWNPQPWVFVTAGPETTENQTYPITATNWTVVGQRICITGAFFGNSNCGVVTQLGVTATEEDAFGNLSTITDLGRANYCATSGDSGGPLYASNQALGLTSSQYSQCDNLYQGIRQAEANMNVKILLAP